MNSVRSPQPSYTPPPASPPPKKRRRKLRLFWVLIPASLWLLSYICSNVEPVFSWKSIMRLLNVQDTQMFTQVFVLGVIATAIVIIIKALKKNK